MEANRYLDLGLDAALAACTCFRKSLLMLASNFLVGTRFSSSLFCFASIAKPPYFEFDVFASTLNEHRKSFYQFCDAIGFRSIYQTFLAIRTGVLATLEHIRLHLGNRVSHPTAAFAFQFDCQNISRFNDGPLLCGHIPSEVTL